MKVRDAIKRLEEDGWRLNRTKGATVNIAILRKKVRLPLQDIRQWTFHPEH
jgi:hypothetical protein